MRDKENLCITSILYIIYPKRRDAYIHYIFLPFLQSIYTYMYIIIPNDYINQISISFSFSFIFIDYFCYFYLQIFSLIAL